MSSNQLKSVGSTLKKTQQTKQVCLIFLYFICLQFTYVLLQCISFTFFLSLWALKSLHYCYCHSLLAHLFCWKHKQKYVCFVLNKFCLFNWFIDLPISTRTLIIIHVYKKMANKLNQCISFVLYLNNVTVIAAAENLLQQFGWSFISNWRVYIRAFFFHFLLARTILVNQTNVWVNRKLLKMTH